MAGLETVSLVYEYAFAASARLVRKWSFPLALSKLALALLTASTVNTILLRTAG